MISWIQHHLIRHGRWIFLTLLAVVIVAFVFTIGNTPGCTANQSAYQPQEFYGYDLNSRSDMERLSQKASASVRLRTGRPVQSEQQFQNEIMSRIALLALADRIGIPAPDQESLARYIREQRAFAGPDGAFSRDAYTRFVDSIESNPGMPQGLIVSVLEEDYRMEQVNEALAGPGYYLPTEASAQTQRANTRYTLGTARLSFEDFDPEIEPTEEELRAYYESNKLRYEIPERIEASYVSFPASEFIDQVETPSEEALRSHFIENRQRFVSQHEAAKAPSEQIDADGTEDADEAEVTFDDVREAVTEDLVQARAKRLANEAALEFQIALYENEIARDSAAFNQLLNESGRRLRSIEPYTRTGARERKLSRQMLEAAFDLDDSRYYTDPYSLDDGFGILIYEDRIDPTVPEYEEVADEVLADYTAETKRERFNARGEELKAELEAKLDEGDDFTEAAESLGLTARTYDSFTQTDAPRDLGPAIQQRAQGLDEGELSSMIVSGGNGHFVYVIEKEIPELSDVSEELEEARDFLARYTQMISSSALVNELITRGLPEAEAPESE
ncbi:MAG: SurA N-terminal domain-containing protein [Verrucomicrobiota bacterium]